MGEADEWRLSEGRRRRSSSFVVQETARASSSEAEATTPLSSKSAQRNAARRRRRRMEAEKAKANKGTSSPEEECIALAKQLKRLRKVLRGIEELSCSRTLSPEQRAKLERKEDLEASTAATEARLAELARERARQDEIVRALESVVCDPSCGICFELIEVPTAVQPCKHEFCRGCIESVVRRAKRVPEVACPLCRVNFYDAATKTARLEPALATRQTLKTTVGTCHCGQSMNLSSLRDHLRNCGDPASCYAPRPKFGHTFAKPDFAKAIERAEQENNDDLSRNSPTTPSHDLAAAMLRRYQLSGGRETTAQQRRPPSPEMQSAAAPGIDNAVSTSSRQCSSESCLLENPAASRKARETTTKTASPLVTPVKDDAPLPFIGGSPPAAWVAPSPTRERKLLQGATWGSPSQTMTPSERDCSYNTSMKAPSVHEILAEEEAKKQLQAERLSNPWTGAVARQIGRR